MSPQSQTVLEAHLTRIKDYSELTCPIVHAALANQHKLHRGRAVRGTIRVALIAACVTVLMMITESPTVASFVGIWSLALGLYTPICSLWDSWDVASISIRLDDHRDPCRALDELVQFISA
jgi:hypothetical protein